MLKSPQQMAEFIKTGQIDSLLEDSFKDLVLVREENEDMRSGGQPQVLMTDQHGYHIEEHRTLLSDPEARQDPALVQNVLNHIQQHIMTRKMMDPDLAAVLNQAPLPSQQMAMQGPGPMGPGPEVPPQIGQGEAALPNVPPGTPPEVAQNYADGTGQAMADVQPQGQ